MPKTGTAKTGEGRTGDVSDLRLAAPVQPLALDHPTATATGEGEATLSASAHSLRWVVYEVLSSTKTGEAKTGEAATGGDAMQHQITGDGEAAFAAPVQPLALDHLTHRLRLEESFAAPLQTLQFDTLNPLIGYTVWALDGQQVGAETGEIATHRSLTLSLRAQTSTLTNVLRPLKSDEGQVDVLVTDSGGFVAVDRADGGNTFQLDPPVGRQPLRQIGDYHVRRYEEDLVSQDVDEWDVEIEFVPDANRTDAPGISETPSGDEWGFTTRYGTIATDRVDAQFLGTGSDGVERFEVTARLTFDQSLAFEAALSTVEGVRVRSIPDATNVAVDDTGGEATLTVDSPTNDVLADGDYVVLDWESTRLNDDWQEIAFEIADEG